MANILPREVLFNDGEGLEPDDLNVLQRRLVALISDGILAHHARLSDDGHGGASSSHLFAIGNSGAPYAGAGAAEVLFRAGPVFRRLAGAIDGEDPITLLYFLDQDEPTQAHAAAGAGLERWDLYSIELAQEDADPADDVSRDFKDAVTGALSTQTVGKIRKVAATITVTAGAEAAVGAAVEPATPAGHVKLAAVRVDDSGSAFDPTTDIRDYRVPALGWTVHSVPGCQFGRDPSHWPEDGPGIIIADAGGARDAWAHLPTIGGARRVVEIGLGSNILGGSAAAARLMRMNMTGSILGAVEDELAVITGSLLSAGTNAFRTYDVLGSLGTPLWANGYAAGYAVEVAGGSPRSVALKVTSGASTADMLLLARFWVAG